MNLTKDEYEYLMNFANDRTILNMMEVNKKFSDPEFFERVFKRKYPFLIPFRKEETWKKFYLEMIYSISKLEEIGIPYINVEGYDPKLAYQLYLKMPIEAANYALKFATKGGFLNIVKKLFHLGLGKFNFRPIEKSIKYNHIDILDYFIDNKDDFINIGAGVLDTVLAKSSFYNRIDLVKKAIKKGAKNFNYGLMYAAMAGNIDILKFLIEEKGANKIALAISYAEGDKQIKAAEFLRQYL